MAFPSFSDMQYGFQAQQQQQRQQQQPYTSFACGYAPQPTQAWQQPTPSQMDQSGFAEGWAELPKNSFHNYATMMAGAKPEIEKGEAWKPETYEPEQHATLLRDGHQLVRTNGWNEERIIDRWFEDRHLISERVVDEQVRQVVKPTVLIEKVYEVPQVVVKETVKEVPKPEIVERVIEVPKIEYFEVRQVGPTRREIQERIVEVPQVVVEEIVRHVPKVEVQERIFEVPVPEFREIIEYEDRIEYREVPVDKIVEVPQIEYHVREVEVLVPQTYIQEGKIRNSYVEFPIVQIQEVQRQEMVPMEMFKAPSRNMTPSTPFPPYASQQFEPAPNMPGCWPSYMQPPMSSQMPIVSGSGSYPTKSMNGSIPPTSVQNMYGSYEAIKSYF